MDKRMNWFNYVTGKYELIDTPSDFANYIPQDQAAQGLYMIYQKMGLPPIEAAVKVLKTCVGEKD